MLPTLLIFVGLARATATNTTNITGCPSCDAISCSHRSVWSILASCGLTLLICVWHAVHPALPLPHHKWIHVFLYRVSLMLFAFFLPEWLAMLACDKWCVAKEITKNFHDHGYRWWTMTHSYFVVMGGFALHDNTGIKVIDDEKLLSLLDAKDILNPAITKDDIMDKSASDGLAKAILIFQLFWFATQLVVRLVNHLSVTLVELDTVCIALLTFLLLFFWWEKPYCPRRPHIFYAREFNDSKNFSEGGNSSKGIFQDISIETQRDWFDLLYMRPKASESSSSGWLLFIVWLLFGALHIIAWNYEFPTEIEKTLWRALSLALAGLPMLSFFLGLLFSSVLDWIPDRILDLTVALTTLITTITRVYLVAAMLASLRSLPASAHETIPWTNYIPHL